MAITLSTNKGFEIPAHGDNVNTWDVPVNFDWNAIDAAFGGTTSLNVTGLTTPTTLTVSQYRAPMLIISGTLTADFTYQIPSGVGGLWSIYNGTSGSFNLIIASAGGGMSVTLIPATWTFINCDGTNVNLADSSGSAPLNSPHFTGIPTAPTAPLGTNTTQLANMAALQASRATVETRFASELGILPDGTDQSTNFAKLNLLANRGYRWMFTRGTYKLTNLTYNTVVGSTGGVGGSASPLWISGCGYDANGGADSCIFQNFNNANDMIIISNTLDTGVNVIGNNDTPMWMDGILMKGDRTLSAGGNGVKIIECANAKIEDCWLTGFRNSGVLLDRCDGTKLIRIYSTANRLTGVNISKQFNRGVMRDCTILGNGSTWDGLSSNMIVTGTTGTENLKPLFDNIDVSYAGDLVSWYKISNGSLTSIVVSAGVATAISPAHGRTNGDLVFVTGATSDPNLNSISPRSITVTGVNTFTFSTTSPFGVNPANGTYTEITLQIAPWICGMQISNTHGMEALIYSEDVAGNAIYMGANSFGFDLSIYAQGSGASGVVFLDTAFPGTIHGSIFTGANASLNMGMYDGPHGVDVKSDVYFQNGAVRRDSAVSLSDGQYYAAASPAPPTAGVGMPAWPFGIQVRNRNVSVGAVTGWMNDNGGAFRTLAPL